MSKLTIAGALLLHVDGFWLQPEMRQALASGVIETCQHVAEGVVGYAQQLGSLAAPMLHGNALHLRPHFVGGDTFDIREFHSQSFSWLLVAARYLASVTLGPALIQPAQRQFPCPDMNTVVAMAGMIAF